MSFMNPIWKELCATPIGVDGVEGFLLTQRWRSGGGPPTELLDLPSITDIDGVPVENIINLCVTICPYFIAAGAVYPKCDGSGDFTTPEDAWIHQFYLADEASAEIGEADYVIIQGRTATYRYAPEPNPLWTPSTGGKKANKYVYPGDDREMQAEIGWPEFDPIEQYPEYLLDIAGSGPETFDYFSILPFWGMFLVPESAVAYAAIDFADDLSVYMDADALQAYDDAEGDFPWITLRDTLNTIGIYAEISTQGGIVYVRARFRIWKDSQNNPPGFFQPRYGFPKPTFCPPPILGGGFFASNLPEMLLGIRVKREE
jgi:hypothetical protein